MCNPEHLDRLREGVEEWNQWRQENPTSTPNLDSADLSEADLRGLDLNQVNFVGAKLHRADLRGVKLIGADLRRAKLGGALLSWADLSGAILRGALLSGANLRGADLSEADLRGVDLSEINLREANLCQADLRETNFREANLRGANLSGADLTKSNLRSAKLQSACLDGAIITDASLWETQRAAWSIKGIICHRAYWDHVGMDAIQYVPGEFERLYSEQPKIELFYKGGITKFELNTLPALLHHLATLHPNCDIRLKSVEEAASGARVSIIVADADTATFEDIKAEAKRSQEAQIALREDQAKRWEIEKRLLLDEVFPRMLAAAGHQVQIAGDATGIVIAGGDASIQTINDLSAIRTMLDEVMNHRAELARRQIRPNSLRKRSVMYSANSRKASRDTPCSRRV